MVKIKESIFIKYRTVYHSTILHIRIELIKGNPNSLNNLFSDVPVKSYSHFKKKICWSYLYLPDHPISLRIASFNSQDHKDSNDISKYVLGLSFDCLTLDRPIGPI